MSKFLVIFSRVWYSTKRGALQNAAPQFRKLTMLYFIRLSAEQTFHIPLAAIFFFFLYLMNEPFYEFRINPKVGQLDPLPAVIWLAVMSLPVLPRSVVHHPLDHFCLLSLPVLTFSDDSQERSPWKHKTLFFWFWHVTCFWAMLNC